MNNKNGFDVSKFVFWGCFLGAKSLELFIQQNLQQYDIRSFYKRNINLFLGNSEIPGNITAVPDDWLRGQNYRGSGRNPEH
jgi:hypothetical protein